MNLAASMYLVSYVSCGVGGAMSGNSMGKIGASALSATGVAGATGVLALNNSVSFIN